MNLFIARALVRLKTQQDKVNTLKELGINIEPLNDNICDLIAEGIVLLLCGDDDTAFDSCLSDIQWWLKPSDKPKKIVRLNFTPPQEDLDVTGVSDFVKFLIDTYHKK